jgi:hypothetical protein
LLASAATLGFKPSNWEMVVGGCRSGKSTIGAEACQLAGRYAILGMDSRHLDYLQDNFSVGSAIRISSKNLGAYECDRSVYGDLLWIDESLANYNFYKLAERFRRVVWTTWPHDAARDSEFRRVCLSVGSVRHIPMLQAYRAQFSEFAGEEYRARVLGLFS